MTIRLIALVLLAAAWIGVAVAATLLALRRIRASGQAVTEGAFAQTLLDAAPMASFLLFADGRVAIGDRACAWLGLETMPDRLDDFHAAGFAPEQLAALATAAADSFASARPLSLTIRLPGTDRFLALTGGPFADPALPESALLLWIADATTPQTAIDQLTLDRNRLDRALASLTTLIEAAPFPIWQRDATGHLAFVNPAYAGAVEARDAGDAVRRGLELIESGAGRPALRDGVETRIVPAILAGQRRMMRVVDVPLGARGSACFAIDMQEVQDVRADLVRFGEAQRAMLDRLSAGVAQFGVDRMLDFHNANFQRLFALDRDRLDEHPVFDRLLDQMRAAGRVPEMRDFPAWRNDRRGWFQLAEAAEETWQLSGNVHLRIIAQPLPDGGLLMICEDRTEHQALASARDTLLQVRTATLDNLFEGVGVLAADGRLLLWNSRFRETWGLEEDALVAGPHLDTLVQAIGPRLADPRQAGLIRELVRIATLDRRHRAGRFALSDGRHFDYSAVPLPDGNALVAIADITAQHHIEEAAAPPLAADRIDVAALIREVADRAADAATAAGVGLLVDSPARSGAVEGDHARLRGCLDRLVRDALDHTPREGRVRLRSRMLGEWVEIQLSDTGPGISQEDQAKLPGGELPRARQLVAAHGGTFRRHSEPGRGTEIVIHLPAAGT